MTHIFVRDPKSIQKSEGYIAFKAEPSHELLTALWHLGFRGAIYGEWTEVAYPIAALLEKWEPISMFVAKK
ncbi:MAG TPA: hypothetical protein VNH18_06475 [Bryobacteraceae bacterium]|nr:hypothetical protein [Bryobacteraceae bacterium]